LLCKKLTPVNQNILSFLYVNKADAFLGTAYKVDSTLFYLHKAIEIKENPFKYAVVANYYLKENVNIDSAKHYLNKSKVLLSYNAITEYQKATVLHAEANFNKAIGNYKEAIIFYKKSLVIYKKIKKSQEVKLSYKLIYETYEKLEDENSAHKYLLKYTNITDSISAQYNQKINVVISNFLKVQEKGYQEKEKKFSFFIGIVVLLFVGIIILIIYNYRKKRQKIIVEKEKIIKQKNLESIQLKEKLNIAFDEVISLAKINDASFLGRFQEVYPNVCDKLLETNPKLVNTELTLCAMIWLNFSSKDIASYINVQPKTVQTKKYRLRKKLNIPEAVNIYVWIKNL
jgi:tetratricopeptide (TPR) repeat protein